MKFQCSLDSEDKEWFVLLLGQAGSRQLRCDLRSAGRRILHNLESFRSSANSIEAIFCTGLILESREKSGGCMGVAIKGFSS